MLKDPKAAQSDLVSAEFEKVGKKLWLVLLRLRHNLFSLA